MMVACETTGRQVPKLKGTAKAPRRQVPEFLGALAPWRLLLWVPGGSLLRIVLSEDPGVERAVGVDSHLEELDDVDVVGHLREGRGLPGTRGLTPAPVGGEKLFAHDLCLLGR
jgi:hypothetical protein